jgi:hypothetical protein
MVAEKNKKAGLPKLEDGRRWKRAGTGRLPVVGYGSSDGGGPRRRSLCWRWRTTVAGSCENGRRNDGERTMAEDGERRWRVVRGGQRWEDFGVEGEREAKFGGKFGEQK